MKNLLYLGLVSSMVAGGIAAYQNWFYVTIAIAGIAAILAILGVLYVYNIINDVVVKNRYERQKMALQLERLAIDNDHANIQITTAPAGHQVLIGMPANSNLKFSPAHLGGQVNGQWQPTQKQLQLQHNFNQLYAPGSKKLITPPPEAAPVLAPLLPVLLQSGRVLIGGGSDSGKSTLAKHLITQHAGDQIIPIDPHSPSKLLGYDVIGAGRDYEAIGDALAGLVSILDDRYLDIKNDICKYGDHPPIFVIIDELTSIQEKCEGAADTIKTLLTESRKVNMSIVLLIHSLDTKTLGIPSGIRSSSRLVWLEGGNGKDRAAYILPDRGPQARRADWIEYTLPGQFAGYPEAPGVVVQMPPARDLKINNLARQGFSKTAIAKTIFDVKKPNGGHLKEIKNALANNAERTL